MDEKSRRSFHAAVWYIISNFISKALIYICTPLYTRLLTTSEYGEYSNFLSWQSILATLITFDLSAAVGIAYYDYGDENKFDGFINTISVCSYVIPACFCAMLLIFSNRFSALFSIRKKYLVILTIYITFGNTLNIFQAEQRVRLKYKFSAVLTLATSALTVVCTLIFVFKFQDRLQGVLLGGVLINIIVSFVLGIRIWLRNSTIQWEFAKYALAVAVPLIPHVLAGTILGSSDKVMIMRYCGENDTALYGLTYTIAMIITMIASSMNKAWAPWFFDRMKYNKREHIKKIANIVVLAIAACSFLICLLAPEILFVIGGRAYTPSAVLMPPIICACLFNCVSTFYINIEFYNKKTGGISIATMVSAFLNVLMNYIFIRRFGYAAAAYTTWFSSAVTLFFHIYKIKRQGMLRVFENRFFLLILMFFSIASECMVFLYDKYIIRYIFLIIILIVFSICGMRTKKQILSANSN